MSPASSRLRRHLRALFEQAVLKVQMPDVITIHLPHDGEFGAGQLSHGVEKISSAH